MIFYHWDMILVHEIEELGLGSAQFGLCICYVFLGFIMTYTTAQIYGKLVSIPFIRVLKNNKISLGLQNYFWHIFAPHLPCV